MNNYIGHNKKGFNVNTETNGKFKEAKIGNINNTIQNTIKKKYIIINKQIK